MLKTARGRERRPKRIPKRCANKRWKRGSVVDRFPWPKKKKRNDPIKKCISFPSQNSPLLPLRRFPVLAHGDESEVVRDREREKERRGARSGRERRRREKGRRRRRRRSLCARAFFLSLCPPPLLSLSLCCSRERATRGATRESRAAAERARTPEEKRRGEREEEGRKREVVMVEREGERENENGKKKRDLDLDLFASLSLSRFCCRPLEGESETERRQKKKA